VAALALLLPIRLFEVANPDWRPLGWLHALVVVSVTLIALWRIGGAPWLRHFAFPVAFILVAVPWVTPIEQPIVQGLMRAVAAIAAETLNLLGIPAQLEGSVIRVSSGVVGVNEACSGVRSLQTSIMIGLLFGELKRFSLRNRLLLLVGAAMIAFVANCARAFFLVYLASTRGVAAVGQWHDTAGYAILAAVFCGTLGLAWILAKHSPSALGDPQPALRIPRSSIRHSPFAVPLLFLAWLLAVEVAVEGWYRWHERDLVSAAPWNVQFPESASDFRTIPIDPGVRDTLRFDVGHEAAWTLASGAAPETEKAGGVAHVFGFFFRWNAGGSSVLRARAHRPDICLPSAGWVQTGDRGSIDYGTAAGVTIPVREVTFRSQRSNAIAHTFFCLQEDQRRPSEARPDLQLAAGTQPDWSIAGRTRVVLNGVRNLGQQVLEVVIVGGEQLDDTEADQKFRQLLQSLVVPVSARR
jgi:exosortase